MRRIPIDDERIGIFSTDFVTSKKGEILVITVEKRKEIPHALVNRSEQHIKSRTYYIREKNRKMLVDDQLLKVLFTHR
ncbi:MAG: hypothetical protein QG670_1385 [Thermoproteota archaeon]|nr:hypothetical protein [Thermoproteota archaeon]